MPETDVPGLRTTYAAALQHDQADVPDEATRVGIVRRPLPWFSAAVDENVAELGPPPELLETFQDRAEAREHVGLDEVTAHNEAWDEVDYEVRYRAHLEKDDGARAALEDLVERVRGGEEVVLVCYEAPEKECHRHLLVEVLRDRV